jgi:predicted acyltransferase
MNIPAALALLGVVLIIYGYNWIIEYRRLNRRVRT